MKFSFILFFFFVQLAHAQIQEGFNPDELKTCIALCNSFTFLDLYGNDQEIIPNDCNKTFESSTIGLDNKFQIYRQKNRAIINFRGSTDQITSWIENRANQLLANDLDDVELFPYSTAITSGYVKEYDFIEHYVNGLEQVINFEVR